jgi:Flp pilus assembly protein TadD
LEKDAPPLAKKGGFSYGKRQRPDMSGLEASDAHRLRAAEGWLELGNAAEAGRELDQIPAGEQSHPDVLEARWSVSAALRDWAAALAAAEQLVVKAPDRPSGWIDRSYSLHELNRSQEARDWLMPAVALFPKLETIPYNLACYECRLGRLAEARKWLAQALAVGRREEMVALASRDRDLEPLWPELK